MPVEAGDVERRGAVLDLGPESIGKPILEVLKLRIEIRVLCQLKIRNFESRFPLPFSERRNCESKNDSF